MCLKFRFVFKAALIELVLDPAAGDKLLVTQRASFRHKSLREIQLNSCFVRLVVLLYRISQAIAQEYLVCEATACSQACLLVQPGKRQIL